MCPDAWLLNYTNPMAMNIGYLAATHPDLKVLGLCHSVYWTMVDLCELVGAPVRRDRLPQRRRQPPGLDPRLAALAARTSTTVSTSSIAADPELRRRVRVDMYRRLGFYPTETSEHSSEYVPWYLHDDAEIERLRLPIRDYVGISAANVEETEQLIAEAATGEYVEPEEDAAEYAPQVIHSMVTGHRREIQANVVNRGLIDNLPAGGADRGALRDRRATVPTRSPSATCPSQCAALNRTFLSVVDLTVRAATELPARAHPARADGRPEHRRPRWPCDEIWRLADAMVAAHEPLLPTELRARLGAP